MKKGYKYPKENFPHCGDLVAENWWVRHMKRYHPATRIRCPYCSLKILESLWEQHLMWKHPIRYVKGAKEMYTVVRRKTLEKLAAVVNQKEAEEGWKPIGGIAVEHNRILGEHKRRMPIEVWYLQVMVYGDA